MFCESDTVFYRCSGVCAITGIEKKNFYGKTTEYYVLHPMGDSISTFFVPIGKEDGAMRPILSKQEAWSLLDALPGQPCLWIGNDNLRREQYKKIISDGNPSELATLIRAIYFHQLVQKAVGKKLHAADEALLRVAQELLCGELSFVLGIGTAEVLRLIVRDIDVKGEE